MFWVVAYSLYGWFWFTRLTYGGVWHPWYLLFAAVCWWFVWGCWKQVRRQQRYRQEIRELLAMRDVPRSEWRRFGV